jgi:hypothetical protein
MAKGFKIVVLIGVLVIVLAACRSSPQVQPPVAELIAEYGEPSHVWVAIAFSSDVQCAGAFLMFTEVGLRAFLNPVGNFVGVRPEQTAQRLEWMSPEDAKVWSITDHAKIDWQDTPNIVGD